MTTMNRKEARAAGYRALTGNYHLPEEQGMLDAVVADMRRGNIGYVLVKDRLGVAVWRRGCFAMALAPRNPSPLAPLPVRRGEGSFSQGAVTRGGGLAALPRATILNPAGVLKSGRRSSAN